MSATISQSPTCPKCRQSLPLTVFKLRSRLQGRSPSWCKACRNQQDRSRRAHQRQREVNEYLRRIRLNTPPTRVAALIASAARRAGGVTVVASQLTDRLRSPHTGTACRAARLVLKLLCAANHNRASR